MVTFGKLTMALVFSCCFSAVLAQKPKPAPTKPVAPQRFIPPRLSSNFGNRTDTTGLMLAEEAVQLIGLPIKVTDDKKTVYSMVSYQAMYKRRGVTEEDVNGEVKVKPIMTSVSDRFKTTPLPPIWVSTIKEQLRAGEEVLFFDIVVKDAQGRMMFAPDIKIKIK